MVRCNPRSSNGLGEVGVTFLCTILTEMVAILIYRKLDLPLHRQCNSIPPSPKLDLRQEIVEHQSMQTARHHICIYHVILIGLGQN